jgi:hypothetical protein
VVDQIDRESGLRATPRCPVKQITVEYFIPGTEPQGFCPIHGGRTSLAEPPR